MGENPSPQMTFETQEVERNASPALRPQFSAVLSPHLLPWSARRGRTLCHTSADAVAPNKLRHDFVL